MSEQLPVSASSKTVPMEKVVESMIDELLKLDGLRMEMGFNEDVPGKITILFADDETSRSILKQALEEGMRQALPIDFFEYEERNEDHSDAGKQDIENKDGE